VEAIDHRRSNGRRRSTVAARASLAKPLLITGLGRDLSGIPIGRRDEDIEIRRVPALPTTGTLVPNRPTVILLDKALLQSIGAHRERLEEAAESAALIGIGEPGEFEPSDRFPTDLLSGFIPGSASEGLIRAALRGGFRHAVTLVAERASRIQAQLRHRELAELTRVGVALSTERDLLSLLDTILTQARRITNSDAGSLYLVERDPNGGQPTTLRFKLSQNSSIPNIPLGEFTVEIDHSSLAGYTAATGEPLSIADVYLLPSDATYKQNRSFDEKFGYRTKSMLVIPMTSHRDEIVGVLQLINRKRSRDSILSSPETVSRRVISYDQRSVELVSALASQAAVAIENSLLYEDIERLFEGFVTAAVTAIESRDPTTYGHSGRVATMTVGLAEVIDRASDGPYRDVRFTKAQLRELRYAGLLHDFGKVGVREEVLIKQKKLYPANLEIIRHRFAFLLQTAELEFERARNDQLVQNGPEGCRKILPELERVRDERRRELQSIFDVIVAANEPTVLPEGSFSDLEELAARTYTDVDGSHRPFISPEELRFLSIRKGTLDENERDEIESHVSHTFRFLQQIPWTRELRGIPAIAYGHHEKLNGRGYPRGVTGKDIPVQTRMMTIADIYDALTATDRPYKRAVSLERALDILHMEAREGMLDQALLDAFVQARVFQSVGEE
jgi:HD-GYP domain-containing protein (c-di-GMP phosphodiesterase class II)